MTTDKYPIGEAIKLPKLGSWPESFHVFDTESTYALMAAEAAQRPLLVRGEPGTGKSQLARAAAVCTGRLFLSKVVNARTECQDLQWQFDAVGRLAEAQTLAQANEQEIQRRMDPLRFLSPGPLWWVFDWNSAQSQWNDAANKLEPVPQKPNKNWQPNQGSVLLFDEIDKADVELPNSLLETLGNGDFAVPYLDHSVRQSKDCPSPLVIITTNEERELPAAFLRRCLVLHLSLPKDDDELTEQLSQRGQVHFGNRCSKKVRQIAAKLLLQDRKAASSQGLPQPGQAEYLDMLRALSGMAKGQKKQMELLEKISGFVLKKSPDLLP